MFRGEALDFALALHAAPSLAGQMRARPLPDGIAGLLRLAAAQPEAVAEAAALSGKPAARLVEAARFFVEQMMLARECAADPWRVLGLRANAPAALAREHHRLLMRLVHPDRDEEWASLFAYRVNRAWMQLRRGEGGEDGESMPIPPPQPESAPAGFDFVRPPFAGEAPVFAAPAAPPRRRWRTASAAALLIATGGVAGYWAAQRTGVESGTASDPAALSAMRAPLREEPAPPRASPSETAADTSPEAAAPSFEAVANETAVIETVAAEPAPAPPAPAPPDAASPPVAGTAPKPEPAIASAPATEPPPRIRSTPPAAPVPVAARQPMPSTAAAASLASAPPAAAMAPAPAPTPQPDAADEAPPADANTAIADLPTDAETVDLLKRFTLRYSEGDVEGLIALFSPQAHAASGGLSSLQNGYADLFSTTSQRGLLFRDATWRADGGKLSGQGRYEARFKRRGEFRKRLVTGLMNFQLIRENGEPRLLLMETREESGGA